jgi:methylated-DNA-[protein]-cysteine S-methyltransferase
MDGSCNAMISRRSKSPQRAEARSLVTGVPIETAGGMFVASFSDDGLVALDFPKSAGRMAAKRPIPANVARWQRLIATAINNLLAGREPGELPPFDWSGRSDFQQKVWRTLLKIAPGRTRTYSEIAESIGAIGAARAVGTACGANPIPVLVPCHRVLAAGGKLGGFSGGLDWKRRLLAAEKAQLL